MLSSFSFSISAHYLIFFFFFFNDPAPTEIYTLSLHDALPIYWQYMSTDPESGLREFSCGPASDIHAVDGPGRDVDRKSTRLNSSHSQISYAVFCLKKKKKKKKND